MNASGPNMVVLYAESYRAVYNTLSPEVRLAVDHAFKVDSFYPKEVKEFCRQVCENAERITTLSRRRSPRPQLNNFKL
jgi:hypothetical protein